jgi:hypothetical protein
MNMAMATNGKPYGEWIFRTKINQWRAPSKKILLTESWEKLVFEPTWSYGTELTRRHGAGISHGNAVMPPGARMGINVSAAFLDGHAEPIDDDFANKVGELQYKTLVQ